jgi:hypothetical protein
MMCDSAQRQLTMKDIVFRYATRSLGVLRIEIVSKEL